MYRVGGSTGVFGRLKTVPPDAFYSTDFQTVEGAMDVSRGDYYRVRRACLVEGMSVREASRVFDLHRDTMPLLQVRPGSRRYPGPIVEAWFLLPALPSAEPLPVRMRYPEQLCVDVQRKGPD